MPCGVYAPLRHLATETLEEGIWMKWIAWTFIGIIIFAIFAGLFRWGVIMMLDLIDSLNELRRGKTNE